MESAGVTQPDIIQELPVPQGIGRALFVCFYTPMHEVIPKVVVMVVSMVIAVYCLRVYIVGVTELE